MNHEPSWREKNKRYKKELKRLNRHIRLQHLERNELIKQLAQSRQMYKELWNKHCIIKIP